MTAPFPVRDWTALAACRTADPEIFFPAARPDTRAFKAQARKAITWCAGCTVRPECLRFALANRIGHGVFGGLTARERATVLRRERSAA